MKPTKLQMDTAYTIREIIRELIITNDINSPSIYSEMGDELLKLDLSDDDYNKLESATCDLITIIQNLNQ